MPVEPLYGATGYQNSPLFGSDIVSSPGAASSASSISTGAAGTSTSFAQDASAGLAQSPGPVQGAAFNPTSPIEYGAPRLDGINGANSASSSTTSTKISESSTATSAATAAAALQSSNYQMNNGLGSSGTSAATSTALGGTAVSTGANSPVSAYQEIPGSQYYGLESPSAINLGSSSATGAAAATAAAATTTTTTQASGAASSSSTDQIGSFGQPVYPNQVGYTTTGGSAASTASSATALSSSTAANTGSIQTTNLAQISNPQDSSYGLYPTAGQLDSNIIAPSYGIGSTSMKNLGQASTVGSDVLSAGATGMGATNSPLYEQSNVSSANAASSSGISATTTTSTSAASKSVASAASGESGTSAIGFDQSRGLGTSAASATGVAESSSSLASTAASSPITPSTMFVNPDEPYLNQVSYPSNIDSVGVNSGISSNSAASSSSAAAATSSVSGLQTGGTNAGYASGEYSGSYGTGAGAASTSTSSASTSTTESSAAGSSTSSSANGATGARATSLSSPQLGTANEVTQNSAAAASASQLGPLAPVEYINPIGSYGPVAATNSLVSPTDSAAFTSAETSATSAQQAASMMPEHDEVDHPSESTLQLAAIIDGHQAAGNTGFLLPNHNQLGDSLSPNLVYYPEQFIAINQPFKMDLDSTIPRPAPAMPSVEQPLAAPEYLMPDSYYSQPNWLPDTSLTSSPLIGEPSNLIGLEQAHEMSVQPPMAIDRQMNYLSNPFVSANNVGTTPALAPATRVAAVSSQATGMESSPVIGTQLEMPPHAYLYGPDTGYPVNIGPYSGSMAGKIDLSTGFAPNTYPLGAYGSIAASGGASLSSGSSSAAAKTETKSEVSSAAASGGASSASGGAINSELGAASSAGAASATATTTKTTKVTTKQTSSAASSAASSAVAASAAGSNTESSTAGSSSGSAKTTAITETTKKSTSTSASSAAGGSASVSGATGATVGARSGLDRFDRQQFGIAMDGYTGSGLGYGNIYAEPAMGQVIETAPLLEQPPLMPSPDYMAAGPNLVAPTPFMLETDATPLEPAAEQAFYQAEMQAASNFGTDTIANFVEPVDPVLPAQLPMPVAPEPIYGFGPYAIPPIISESSAPSPMLMNVFDEWREFNPLEQLRKDPVSRSEVPVVVDSLSYQTDALVEAASNGMGPKMVRWDSGPMIERKVLYPKDMIASEGARLIE